MSGDAREADERGRAVGYIGHPAMVAIAMRKHSGNGKGGGGMTGRKAGIDTGARYMTVEEGIVEKAGGRDVRRTQAPRRYLQHYVKDGAVGVGFTGEEGGFPRVGIVAEMSDHQKGCGNDGDFSCGDASGERVVEGFESGGAAEIGRVVGISDDEGRSRTRYGEGGEPLMAFGKPHGKQPDVFLVLEEISREGAVGDVALCCV